MRKKLGGSFICRPCVSVCHCGKPKDYRAAECLSCGMSRKAKIQWSTRRGTILAGSREASKLRRIRFEDLSWESNWQARSGDGRYKIYYWDGDRKRHIYRYQWVWIKANGPIPAGYSVHHENEDPTCDYLWNLELKTTKMHVRHHTAERAARFPKAKCPICGVVFPAKKRGRDRYRKYCSVACGKLRFSSGAFRRNPILLPSTLACVNA